MENTQGTKYLGTALMALRAYLRKIIRLSTSEKKVKDGYSIEDAKSMNIAQSTGKLAQTQLRRKVLAAFWRGRRHSAFH